MNSNSNEMARFRKLFRKSRLGTLEMFSASFDALATSGTARKLQVSLYSSSEAFCGEILAF